MFGRAWVWYQRLQRLVTNRWVQLLVGAAASGILAFLATRSLSWQEVVDSFLDVPVLASLLSLVPLTASTVLRAARWRILLTADKVSMWHVFLTQNTGIGLNNLLPVRMVSEPVQLAMITRQYRVPFPSAFTTLIAGNVMDVFATAILMGMGVLLVPQLRGASIQLVGAFVLFIASLLVLIIAARGLSSLPVGRNTRFMQQMAVAANLLKESPGKLWASFLASILHWMLLGFTVWIVARGLGMELDVLTLTTIMVATTFFTSAVPSLPGAAGTYEFAMTYTLHSLLGVDRAVAVTFAVTTHVLVFLPPVAIALVVMSRIGSAVLFRGARKASDRLDGLSVEPEEEALRKR
ncbi:MAG: flippase-like domain-containing protein [SAR202 cluster bacterium]|nr:flippase-like domain-containing protein [SAR202 cluster bacterium]